MTKGEIVERFDGKIVIHYIRSDSYFGGKGHVHTHGLLTFYAHPEFVIVGNYSKKFTNQVLMFCIEEVVDKRRKFRNGDSMEWNGRRLLFLELDSTVIPQLEVILMEGEKNESDRTVSEMFFKDYSKF